MDPSNKVDILMMGEMNEYKTFGAILSGYKQKYHAMVYSQFSEIHLSMTVFWKCLLAWLC